jgi:hypothetical protein
MSLSENTSFRDGYQFAWDSTSLSLAQTCLRKYKYKMIDGWQSPRLSVHLLFGQLYATALEHFYKHRAEGADTEEALRRVVREAMEGSWDSEKKVAREFDHSAKTRANLIRSIIWYVDQFGDEEEAGIKTHHFSDGRPAVEVSFSLEVDDGIFFSGHLDRISEYGGALYVMDQKTTGNTITPKFFDGFKPDIQMSMYTFAGQAILRSPVKGVIIDGAQIAVGFTRFERGFTFRTSSELQEWYDEMMWLVKQTQQATALRKFPMDRTACGNYGGCEFRHVCARSPEVREQFLKAEFVQGKRWDPLERR